MKPLNLTIVALSAVWVAHAHAQPASGVPDVRPYCSSFDRKPDGSWAANKQVIIQRSTGRLILESGVKATPGKPMGGFDLAAALTAQCSFGNGRP